MIYGNFENPQSGARRFHLHLQIPAVGFFAHRQFLERVAPDRAKRTHVGVAHAIQDRHQPASDFAGKDLLEVHATRLTLAARARADHEIAFTARDWIDKLRHKFRAIAAVAIEKCDDVALWRYCANSRRAGATVSARGSDNARPRFTRALGCSISTAIIYNDDLTRN